MVTTEDSILRVGRIHRRDSEATSTPTESAILTRILPALRGALAEGHDDRIRATAAIALGKIGATRPDLAEAIAEALLPMMTNARNRESGYVEESAALGLGLLKSHDPVVVFALGDKLLGRRGSGRHERTKAYAAVALGLLSVPPENPVHDRVVHAFRRSLRQPSSRADVPASTLLGMGLSGDPDVLPDLLARVTGDEASDDDLLRSYALSALGRLAGSAPDGTGPKMLDPMLVALREGRPHSARSAAIALGQIADRRDLTGKPRETIVRSLSQASFEKSGPAVGLAMMSLGRVAAKIPDAETRVALRRDLETLVTEGTSTARPYAALALALHGRDLGGEEARELSARLRRSFETYRGNPVDRGALAIALGLLGDQKAGTALLAVLSDRREMGRLRGYCGIALGMLADRRASERIRGSLLTERDEALRAELAIAAGMLGDREAVRVLLDILVDPDTGMYVQGCVAISLGRLGERACIEPLIEILEDDDAPTVSRVRAVIALGMIGDGLDRPTLTRVTANANYRAQVEAVSEILRIF